MKKIYLAQHPTEAHFVKGLLETHNIECEIQGEDLFGGRGELPVTIETLPSVWIYKDEDFDKAQQIITDYERRYSETKESGASWICKQCGEASEPQFTNCWNCGADRPSN